MTGECPRPCCKSSKSSPTRPNTTPPAHRPAAPSAPPRDGGIGSTTGAGICHAYTPDGRCVSLLKILLTNFCLYDCAYCVSRRSSNVERARFTVEEVVQLTLDLYRRNCIEGLFLSSGIARNEDDTMGDLVRVAKTLRTEHGFRGYIHLKTIPGASADLIERGGPLCRPPVDECRAAKRDVARRLCAGEKRDRHQERAGRDARLASRAHGDAGGAGTIGRAARRGSLPPGSPPRSSSAPTRTDDIAILDASASLYASYRLKRVYYSAFSPTGHPSAQLPQVATPLMREHRLYQADWLMRFYGFSAARSRRRGALRHAHLDIDPKLAWALEHRGDFPVDVNRAGREMLLRVPGLGVRAVDRIIAARRSGALRLDDVARLSGALAADAAVHRDARLAPGRAAG